jgi:CheY-like chemotaxis protein/HPt (histidine-containing phosphotransfer) domain-containing protein
MKKIAVVEDNPDNRLLVRVILEPLYEVTEYETGFAGLEGLQRERPDLVLLDISLPEMDGPEVLRRIRADANLKDLPVIALTAHAMSGDREKYLNAGFNDYVTKPIVDEAVLLDAIRKLLSGSPSAAPAAANMPRQLEAALENLRRLGGAKFAAEMIDLFFEYTRTKLIEARQAYAAGNGDGLAKAVHPIKSSAGNVGAARVAELAAQIEHAARTNPTGDLGGLLGELEAAFAEIKPKLEAGKNAIEKAGA